MFEKEAEENGFGIGCTVNSIVAWQKGAAFGYNKAKEEMQAQIEKMKNCFNCAKGDWNDRVKCISSGCVNKSKWELKND